MPLWAGDFRSATRRRTLAIRRSVVDDALAILEQLDPGARDVIERNLTPITIMGLKLAGRVIPVLHGSWTDG